MMQITELVNDIVGACLVGVVHLGLQFVTCICCGNFDRILFPRSEKRILCMTDDFDCIVVYCKVHRHLVKGGMWVMG